MNCSNFCALLRDFPARSLFRFLSRSLALPAVSGCVFALLLAISASAQAPATPASPETAQPPAAGEPAQAPSQAAPAATHDTPPLPTPNQQPAPQPQDNSAFAPTASSFGLPPSTALTEDQLKQLLVGKDFFLRGGYLGDSVSFNEDGRLNGHAPFGSYTLCAVRIDKVRLGKHKVELEGARYGLHFLGALPYEDPTKAMDRVRITPKKKTLRLTIDRETVVKPKKVKEPKPAKGKSDKPGIKPAEATASEPPAADNAPAEEKSETATATPAPSPTENAAPPQKTEAAAALEEDSPATGSGTTTTTSPAHANRVLIGALNHIFATGIDDKMLSAMPKFWQLYYQAAAAKTDYRPADPTVMRQNTVDQKAKLLTNFEPGSNEYAQANGVAGMALYHVVIGSDGKPGEIAVARPIGFGLDESAVDSIRKASFAPAQKDGKPVPVLLDLVVQFRIYSKRTAVTGTPEPAEKVAEPKLPGPYTVQRPRDGN